MKRKKIEGGKTLVCSFSWIMSSLSFLAAPVSLSHGFSEENVADCDDRHDPKTVLLNNDIWVELF